MVVSPFHRDKGIGDAQVRVLPDPDHREQIVVGPFDLPGAMDVEVVAIVEIPVGGPDKPRGLGDLMDRVVVKGRKHGEPR